MGVVEQAVSAAAVGGGEDDGLVGVDRAEVRAPVELVAERVVVGKVYRGVARRVDRAIVWIRPLGVRNRLPVLCDAVFVVWMMSELRLSVVGWYHDRMDLPCS